MDVNGCGGGEVADSPILVVLPTLVLFVLGGFIPPWGELMSVSSSRDHTSEGILIGLIGPEFGQRFGKRNVFEGTAWFQWATQ